MSNDTITFTAVTIHGLEEVTGTPWLHGLVLHPTIKNTGNPKLTLSDPISGGIVCYTNSPESCEGDFDNLVNEIGGLDEFGALIEKARALVGQRTNAITHATEILKGAYVGASQAQVSWMLGRLLESFGADGSEITFHCGEVAE